MAESSAWIVVILSSVGALLCTVALHRNTAMYRVHKAFLDRRDWEDVYFRLPSYEQMLYSPKYLLLWTPTHWEAWVERQGVAAQSQEA